jgi:hypothetical protein
VGGCCGDALGELGCSGELPLSGGLALVRVALDKYEWPFGTGDGKRGRGNFEQPEMEATLMLKAKSAVLSLFPSADPSSHGRKRHPPPAKTTRCQRRRKRRVAAWKPRPMPAIPLTELSRGPVTMPLCSGSE